MCIYDMIISTNMCLYRQKHLQPLVDFLDQHEASALTLCALRFARAFPRWRNLRCKFESLDLGQYLVSVPTLVDPDHPSWVTVAAHNVGIAKINHPPHHHTWLV